MFISVVRVAIVSLSIVALASAAEAKTLYVNPGHTNASDATTWASNSESMPWATLSRALRGTTDCNGSNPSEAARAGDEVIVSPGTYSCVGKDRYDDPAFKAVNEGTSSTNLLTVRCSTPGGCNLRLSSGWGPVFGCRGEFNDFQNYIMWHGFRPDPNTNTGGDTAPVVVKYTNGCQIRSSVITTAGPGNRGIQVKTDPAYPPRFYEARGIVSCTATSPTVCTAVGTHYFDYQTGDKNVVYISGNSAIPDGIYVAVSHNGCCIYPFASPNQFTLIEGEPGLGFNGGYVNLSQVGTGGTYQALQDDTNSAGIRIEYVDGAIIADNHIWHVHAASNPINGACIETYRISNVIFEHNTLHDCGAGIHLKGASPPWLGQGSVLRNNLIYNIGTRLNGITGTSSTETCSSLGVAAPCIWPLARDYGYGFQGAGMVFFAGATGTAEAPIRVYQNIVYDAPEAVEIRHLGAGSQPAHLKIVNNTFDDSERGVRIIASVDMPTGASHLFWNNIVTRMSTWVWDHADSSIDTNDLNITSLISMEHNRYFQNSATFSQGGSGDLDTFIDWRNALTNQERQAPSSGTGDPGLVNPLGRDYHLTPGSNARTAGVDILNLMGGGTSAVIPIGAYITGTETIGARGSIDMPPAAPSNFRLQP